MLLDRVFLMLANRYYKICKVMAMRTGSNYWREERELAGNDVDELTKRIHVEAINQLGQV